MDFALSSVFIGISENLTDIECRGFGHFTDIECRGFGVFTDIECRGTDIECRGMRILGLFLLRISR